MITLQEESLLLIQGLTKLFFNYHRRI